MSDQNHRAKILGLGPDDMLRIPKFYKGFYGIEQLKGSSVSDKRELLANLRSRLNYKDKKITMIVES